MELVFFSMSILDRHTLLGVLHLRSWQPGYGIPFLASNPDQGRYLPRSCFHCGLLMPLHFFGREKGEGAELGWRQPHDS